MSAIRLRFVRQKDIPSFLIGMFQDGFWATHVETVMPDGTYLGARFRGGVLARPAGYDKKTMAREEFVDVEMTLPEENAYYDFLRDQLDKSYDLSAIFGMIVHRNWRDPSRWFCSELVAGGFCACKKFPEHLAVDLDRITPRDMRLICAL